jgi:hypothetical protein
MSRRFVPLVAGVLSSTTPVLAVAQTEASLGVGAGTVRFPGGSVLGVGLLTPALRLTNPSREVTLGGSVAALPHGNGYVQGRIGGWAMSPPLWSGWRVAGELELTGATRTAGGGGSASGAGKLSAELLLATRSWGIGLGAGPVTGAISGAAPVTAFQGRLRGWWQRAPAGVVFSAVVEPTRFLGAWFTDVSAGIDVRRHALHGRAWVLGRVSSTYGSRAAANAWAGLRLSPSVSLEGSFGSVLPDPYQGFPASGFVSAGVRVRLVRRAAPPAAIVRSRVLSVTRRPGGLLLRYRPGGASPRSVAIAGDWNGWSPQRLTRVGGSRWEATVPLGPGTYRFMLVVDGAPWAIPNGVPSIPDGMSGRVAVLSVF